MPSLSPQWEARSFSLPTLSLFSSRRLVRWRRRFLFTHPRLPSPLLRRALHSQRRYNWPKSAAATRSKPSGINVIEPTEICYNNACGGGGGGKSSSFSLLFTLQPLRGSHTQCVTDTNRSWLLSRIVGTFSFIFPVFTIFETDFFSWSPLFASSTPITFFSCSGCIFYLPFLEDKKEALWVTWVFACASLFCARHGYILKFRLNLQHKNFWTHNKHLE